MQNADALMLEILPENLKDASSELAGYFQNSFGNKTRYFPRDGTYYCRDSIS
jgi:hypothetical protein